MRLFQDLYNISRVKYKCFFIFYYTNINNLKFILFRNENIFKNYVANDAGVGERSEQGAKPH